MFVIKELLKNMALPQKRTASGRVNFGKLHDANATPDLLAIQLEGIIRNIPGTRSVYAERTAGGYFLDFDLKRNQLARYGLSIHDAQMTISSAIGGEDVTQTVEGQERYSVNVRYPSELRDSVEKLKHVLIATPSGAQVPLGQVADIVLRAGPSMIRNENGLLAGYVYVDVAGRVYLHREEGYKRFFMTIFSFAFGLNMVVLAGTIDILFAGSTSRSGREKEDQRG